MKLPSLQELTLVGCIAIDDDALGSLERECSKSLQVRCLWQFVVFIDLLVTSKHTSCSFQTLRYYFLFHLTLLGSEL
jgi:hypothetical protein